MSRLYTLLLSAFLLFSCTPSKKVDLILFNGTIHSYGSQLITANCLVVDDGKVVAIGEADSLMKLYSGEKEKDLKGNHVYPGWHDAHAHYAGFARGLQEVDLKEKASWKECVQAIQAYIEQYPDRIWIRGRGWDQNLWGGIYPTRVELDSLFPNHYFYLQRVDGHAALVSGNVLKQLSFDANTRIPGGALLRFERKEELNGVLVDAAADKAAEIVPDLTEEEWRSALSGAQELMLAHGITTVTDAGLALQLVSIIDSLQSNDALKLRMNIMLNPGEKELGFALQHGKIQQPALNVVGFKLYADGALGSRGALLKKPYCDHSGHGLALHDPEYFENTCFKIAKSGFQVNTHCIGDSANRLILETYAHHLKGKNDLRWRIEHAQVVDKQDIHFFKEFAIIPSVQPTHATSDMKWAEDRLCTDRMEGAYAYKSLLEAAGVMPLGTDFPVEEINPMYTLISSVYRQNARLEPEGGFRMEEALDFTTTLRGMTWWPAWSCFREKDWGALEPGMYADFVVYADDLSRLTPKQLTEIKVQETWIGAVKLFPLIVRE